MSIFEARDGQIWLGTFGGGANVLDPAVDVILLDTTFWGGIRPCIKAAGVCETFQFGVAVHSSGELGIQLATMLHLGAVIPNLSFAADAHYHVAAVTPYDSHIATGVFVIWERSA